MPGAIHARTPCQILPLDTMPISAHSPGKTRNALTSRADEAVLLRYDSSGAWSPSRLHLSSASPIAGQDRSAHGGQFPLPLLSSCRGVLPEHLPVNHLPLVASRAFKAVTGQFADT